MLSKEDAGEAQRVAPESVTPAQRLLLLDTWQRSGLPAGDFAAMVGISKHTLYAWKRKFDEEGPGGLVDRPRGGPRGCRLPDLTRRTILMLKQSNPEWGCQRISDMLLRGPALPASASAVSRVLVSDSAVTKLWPLSAAGAETMRPLSAAPLSAEASCTPVSTEQQRTATPPVPSTRKF